MLKHKLKNWIIIAFVFLMICNLQTTVANINICDSTTTKETGNKILEQNIGVESSINTINGEELPIKTDKQEKIENKDSNINFAMKTSILMLFTLFFIIGFEAIFLGTHNSHTKAIILMLGVLFFIIGFVVMCQYFTN